MKRLMRLSLVVVMLMFIIMMLGSNVYATFNCDVDMKIAKTEYSKNDQFTISVDISNITSQKGVIAFGATLEYDKDSLTLVKMEGQNGWETPINGGSYNEDNGIIAITRGALGKNNETVLKLTFQVKETQKSKTIIKLSEVSLADGTELAKVSSISKEITIKEGTGNPDPIIPNEPETPEIPNKPETPNKPTIPGNNESNTNKEDIKDGKLPQAGENDIVMIAVIGISLLGAIILYIRAKKFSDIK